MPRLFRHRLVLPFVWIVAALYLFSVHDRGWIDHDAGTLGQTAERVLQGELPHRDFDDPYTGGLAFLHAAGFAALCVSLHTLRVMLMAWTLAFVPAVYAIAARALPAWACGLVTLLCLAWSVPNYPEAMPSWYNLFFATFGTLSLLKYIETERLRWIVLAGLCGGASILIKLIGLYYVAAVLLFLIFHEQSVAREDDSSGPSRGYGLFVTLGLAAFLLALGRLVGSLDVRVAGIMPVLHFVLPGGVCVGLLLANEWDLRQRAGAPRWKRLTKTGASFLGGVALPIVLFLIPYVISGSLGDWFRGVFIEPLQRFDESTYPLPGLSTVWTAIPLAAMLACPYICHLVQNWFRARSKKEQPDGSLSNGSQPIESRPEQPQSGGESPATQSDAGGDLRVAVGMLFLLALVVLVPLGSRPFVYASVWNSMRHAMPLIVVAACIAIRRRSVESEALDRRWKQQLFLLAVMAALVSLVQIPQAWGIYFCYAVPLSILAVAILVSRQQRAPRGAFTYLGMFYLAFAVIWMNRNDILHLPDRFAPPAKYSPLDVERGGIRVPAQQATAYREMVETIQAHSRPEAFIFATPDVPQVYFLSARGNPTRTLFDLFDSDWSRPPERAERIAKALDEHDVDLAVLHTHGDFSQVVHPPLVRLLRGRYPHVEGIRIGDPDPRRPPFFEIRWRDD